MSRYERLAVSSAPICSLRAACTGFGRGKKSGGGQHGDLSDPSATLLHLRSSEAPRASPTNPARDPFDRADIIAATAKLKLKKLLVKSNRSALKSQFAKFVQPFTSDCFTEGCGIKPSSERSEWTESMVPAGVVPVPH